LYCQSLKENSERTSDQRMINTFRRNKPVVPGEGSFQKVHRSFAEFDASQHCVAVQQLVQGVSVWKLLRPCPFDFFRESFFEEKANIETRGRKI
jgi:hypothetical protein